MNEQPCNRCNYDQIVRQARSLGQDVELRRDTGMNGRQSVYVDGKFVAWFMELPDQCVCG